MPQRQRSYSTNTYYDDHLQPEDSSLRPVSQLSRKSRLTTDENSDGVKLKEWDGVHPRNFLVAHRHKRPTDKIVKPHEYDSDVRRVQEHLAHIEEAERRRVTAILQERERQAERRKVGLARIRDSFIQRRMENEARQVQIMKGKSPHRRSRSVTPFFMRDMYENGDEHLVERSSSRVSMASTKLPAIITPMKHPEATGSAYKAEGQLSELDEFERRLVYIHNTTKEDRIRARMAQVH